MGRSHKHNMQTSRQPEQQQAVSYNNKCYKNKQCFNLPSCFLQRHIESNDASYTVPSYRMDCPTDANQFLAHAFPDSSHSPTKRVAFQVAALNQLAFDHAMSWLLDGNGRSHSVGGHSDYGLLRDAVIGKKDSKNVLDVVSRHINNLKFILNRLATETNKTFYNRAFVTWGRPKTIDFPYGIEMPGDHVSALSVPMIETRFASVHPALDKGQSYAFIRIDLDAKPFIGLNPQLIQAYVKNCAMALQERIENESGSQDHCVGAALILSGAIPDDLLAWFHPDKKLVQQQSAPAPQIEVLYAASRPDHNGQPNKGLEPFLFPLIDCERSHHLVLNNKTVYPELERQIIEAHATPRVRLVLDYILREANKQYRARMPISVNESKKNRGGSSVSRHQTYLECFWSVLKNVLETRGDVVPPDMSLIESMKCKKLSSMQQASITEQIKNSVLPGHAKESTGHALDHEHVLMDMERGADYGLKNLPRLADLTIKKLDDYNSCHVLSLGQASIRFQPKRYRFFNDGQDFSILSVSAAAVPARHIVTPEQHDAAFQQQAVVALMNMALFYAQLKVVHQDELDALRRQLLNLCGQKPQLAHIMRTFCDVLLSLSRCSASQSIRDRSNQEVSDSDASEKTASRDQPTSSKKRSRVVSDTAKSFSPIENIEVYCREVLKCDDVFHVHQQEHFDIERLEGIISLMQSCAKDYSANNQGLQVDRSQHLVGPPLLPHEGIIDQLYCLQLINEGAYCLHDFLSHVTPTRVSIEQTQKDMCLVHHRLRDDLTALLLFDVRLTQHDVVKFIYAKVDGELRIMPEAMSHTKNKRITHSELSNAKNVTAAGELYFKKIDGQWSLYIINNGSGHYRPTQASTLAVVDVVKKVLSEQKIDTSSVHVCNCLEPLAPIYVDTEFSDMCFGDDQTDESSPNNVSSGLTP